MKQAVAAAAACLALTFAGSAQAQQNETVKIAVIEGLSGPLAINGINQLNTWHYLIDHLTPQENPAGVKFEIVPLDSKSSPQEALHQLQVAVDQGIHYVAQGNGSNVAIPLAEAVEKNNERNPGKEVIYLNYAAVDPALTSDKCTYWHFRFDADTTMKMAGLTRFMKDQPGIHKIYLNNQNYSHGHQVAKYFKEGIAKNRPDARIVGEDYVALGQVKDFAPYVAKIKAAGADTLVTGSWGPDFTLLVKAMADAGLNIPIYAYYANATGTPTALARIPGAQVYQIATGMSDYTGRTGAVMAGIKAQYHDDLVTFGIYDALIGLSHAMAAAKSTDPVKVAHAFEGLKFKGHNGDTDEMRASDHQLQQGLWISKWQKVDAKDAYDVEHTGYTFAPVKYLPADVVSTPTSCRMKRPG